MQVSYDNFNKKYRSFKQLQNDLLLVQLCSFVSGLFFIYLLACASQSGLFKKDARPFIGKIIEISALLICVLGLAIGLTNIFYTEKKRAELENQSQQLLDNINKQKATNDEGKQKVSNNKETPEELQRHKDALEKIKKSLAQENYLEKSARYCALAGACTFVIVEILAVTDLFVPFGFSTAHAKIGLPINIQGIADTAGLALILAGVLLKLCSKCEAQKNEKSKSDKKESTLQSFGVAEVAVIGVAINLFGKVIQGMEAGKSIAIFPRADGSSFPLGFSIRIVASLIGIGLLLYSIKSTMDKAPDSELKVDAYYSNQAIGNGSGV